MSYSKNLSYINICANCRKLVLSRKKPDKITPNKMKGDYYFTSESVSEGHPDKLADQISDAVLDAALNSVPDGDRQNVRSACEVLLKGDLLVMAGEVRLPPSVEIDYLQIAEKVIREVGYGELGSGMELSTAKKINAISAQSADISMGVDESDSKTLGAGDQGMMFGYACNEHKESSMPIPIVIAHQLVHQQAVFRKTDADGSILGPDAKSQVTVRYVDGKPNGIYQVVLSTQHVTTMLGKPIQNFDPRFEEFIREKIINPVLSRFSELGQDQVRIHVNPTGKFIIGGPEGDAGLTGRKIIVDTYGGAAPHGGGAFSGKDPSKVDRSAAYIARHIAKNVVKANLATKCTIQLSYVIGKSEPLSLFVDTDGTSPISNQEIVDRIHNVYDLTPGGIIKQLDLWQPIYQQTATYGHFGRTDIELPWEKLDKAESLVTDTQANSAS